MKALNARNDELFAGVYDQVAYFFGYVFHRLFPRKVSAKSRGSFAR